MWALRFVVYLFRLKNKQNWLKTCFKKSQKKSRPFGPTFLLTEHIFAQNPECESHFCSTNNRRRGSTLHLVNREIFHYSNKTRITGKLRTVAIDRDPWITELVWVLRLMRAVAISFFVLNYKQISWYCAPPSSIPTRIPGQSATISCDLNRCVV